MALLIKSAYLRIVVTINLLQPYHEISGRLGKVFPTLKSTQFDGANQNVNVVYYANIENSKHNSK